LDTLGSGGGSGGYGVVVGTLGEATSSAWPVGKGHLVHVVLVFMAPMLVMGMVTMWWHQVCNCHCHFPGHEKGYWYNLELGLYWGPYKVMGAVKHVGRALHNFHSVMLGVKEASTFQIVYGAFQLHPVDYWMLEGVRFVMHLPSLKIRL
jgi:hypothetical protein